MDEELKSKLPLEFGNIENIQNLDTSRMALRWALERIRSLEKINSELVKKADWELKMRLKSEEDFKSSGEFERKHWEEALRQKQAELEGRFSAKLALWEREYQKLKADARSPLARPPSPEELKRSEELRETARRLEEKARALEVKEEEFDRFCRSQKQALKEDLRAIETEAERRIGERLGAAEKEAEQEKRKREDLERTAGKLESLALEARRENEALAAELAELKRRGAEPDAELKSLLEQAAEETRRAASLAEAEAARRKALEERRREEALEWKRRFDAQRDAVEELEKRLSAALSRQEKPEPAPERRRGAKAPPEPKGGRVDLRKLEEEVDAKLDEHLKNVEKEKDSLVSELAELRRRLREADDSLDLKRRLEEAEEQAQRAAEQAELETERRRGLEERQHLETLEWRRKFEEQWGDLRDLEKRLARSPAEPAPKREAEPPEPAAKAAAAPKPAPRRVPAAAGPSAADAERARAVYGEAIGAMRETLEEAEGPRAGLPESLRAVGRALVDSVDSPTLLALAAKTTGDQYLYSHSVNTAILSLRLAKASGWSGDRLYVLGLCALLHELGMLRKLGLTERRRGGDWQAELEPKAHPSGEQGQIEHPRAIEEVMRRFLDEAAASGRALRGEIAEEDLRAGARIIARCDLHEAFSHPRPWREALTPHDALKSLLRRTEFEQDRALNRLFVDILSLYPPGSCVRLSSGEVALVTAARAGAPTRPDVELILDADQGRLDAPRPLALIEDPRVHIVEALDETKLHLRDPGLSAELKARRYWDD